MEWISVKDRLPADKQTVLTCGDYRGGRIISMFYFMITDEGPLWASIPDEKVDEVTHWMPLPDLPKE